MSKHKPIKQKTSTTENKSTSQSKSTSSSKWYRRPTILNILSIAIFFLFSYLILVIRYDTYMYKVESLSLFMSTSTMYAKCMATAGGTITWMSLFLTQTMHNAHLGALIYSLLLSIVWFTAYKVFSTPERCFQLWGVFSGALLLAFTSLGYLIYTIKPTGVAYNLPIGLEVSFLLFGFYRIFKSWYLQTIVMLLIVCTYPFFGAFSLYAALLCAVSIVFVKQANTVKKILSLVPGVMGIVAVVMLPKIWFDTVDSDLIYSQIYLTPLPRFYSNEIWYKVMYASLLAVGVLCALFLPYSLRKPQVEKFTTPYSMSTIGITILLLGFFSDIDQNLKLSLDMDKAIWLQDYELALKKAQDSKVEPTRLNSVLTHIALLRTGRAADRLFTEKYGWEPYGSTRDPRVMHDAGGALISYHLGLTNYSYRWSTENLIGQGLSAERLKIMAKCALLNQDIELARTYIDLLYNTTNHREWAKKYRRYLSDPMKMMADAELSSVKDLMCHPNELINDGGMFEGYIWPLLSAGETGTPAFIDLTMQSALLCRDLNAFMSKLPTYARTNQRLPRHYQEAALLWSMLNNQPCPVQIDPIVEAEHNDFLRAFRSTSNGDGEGQREAMRERFQHTYWYYFVFYDNMQFA